MSKQASKSLIGAFIVGGIALAVAAVAVFGSGKFFSDRPRYLMYFEGSVVGLKKGAPVMFRGVRVGEVHDIGMLFDPEKLTVRIPVVVELALDGIRIKGSDKGLDVEEYVQRMIDKGLRAQLQVQSMVTGQLMIQLDLHPEEPIVLLGGKGEYPEIPTIPSTLERITRTLDELPLDELVNKVTSAVRAFEKYITSPEVAETMKLTTANLSKLHDVLSKVDERLEPLADGMESTLGDARTVLGNLDRQITELQPELEGMVRETRHLVRTVDAEIKPLSASLQGFAESGADAAASGEEALAQLGDSVSKDSTLNRKLVQTLDELSAAARSLRTFAEYLERHPDALVRGKGSP